MSDESRTLVVMRHAKSDWSVGAPDLERPLNARGRRDTAAAAAWLGGSDLGLDIALVSPAVRTRQTWSRVSAGLDAPPECVIEPVIYEAERDELLGALTGLGDDVRTAVLVGHNPGCEELVEALADPQGPAEPRRRMSVGYPTLGIAVLHFEGPWSELVNRSCDLVDFVVPRGSAA